MKSDLAILLRESRDFLESHEPPLAGSAKSYALNNFKSFIDRIEMEPTEDGIARAVHALRHHIVDQFEWSADYCKTISTFCDSADRIRRGLKNC